ncbi:MAG: hypothetical protein [Caudoviricetes sp.]|nr:MAG: hypothetical protein [Caudoviricetes sp.]
MTQEQLLSELYTQRSRMLTGYVVCAKASPMTYEHKFQMMFEMIPVYILNAKLLDKEQAEYYARLYSINTKGNLRAVEYNEALTEMIQLVKKYG